jgi:hypothetical protein
MKSKLLSRGVPSKQFAEDINAVANLTFSPASLGTIAKSVSEYILAPESRGEVKALETLRQECPLSPAEMEAVLGVGAFLLHGFDEKDSIDDIMADIETLGLIDPSKFSNMRAFFVAFLAEFKDRFAAANLAKSAQRSGLNIIRGVTHLVDLRAVVENPWELDQDVGRYKPSVKRLVPVAIVKMRLSGDEEFVFQMDHRTLAVLQNELRAIEKELDQTIAFVGKDKVTQFRN